MLKRLFTFLVITIYFALGVNGASAEEAYDYEQIIELKLGEKHALVNGNAQSLDEPAFEKNGRTLVPLRFVGQALGAEVNWDAKANTATLTLNSTRVKVTLNSQNAYIDGKLTKLDVAAEDKNKRLFVPLRFISEAFGADVNFYAESGTVVVILIDKTNWKPFKLPQNDVELLYPSDWLGEIDQDGYVHFKSPLGTECWYASFTKVKAEVVDYLAEDAKNNGYYLVDERHSEDDKVTALVFLRVVDINDRSKDMMYLFSVQDLDNGSVVVEEVLTQAGLANIDLPIVNEIALSVLDS